MGSVPAPREGAPRARPGDVDFTGEELARGGTALAILRAGDLGLPHHMLEFGSHGGGGFAVAHLRALRRGDTELSRVYFLD